MNIKQLFSFILFFILCEVSSAQKIETKISWLRNIPDAKDNIVYNPKQKLSIADFKGVPDDTNTAVAITSSGFTFKAGYRYENNKATLAISLYCSFNKNESWMKEKGKTAYILAHEQRHFDISYLSTMQFIKRVQQTTFAEEGYMEQLKAIYKEVVQQMSELQRQYDTETNNGINTAKQEEWNKKIEKQLSDAIVFFSSSAL